MFPEITHPESTRRPGALGLGLEAISLSYLDRKHSCFIYDNLIGHKIGGLQLVVEPARHAGFDRAVAETGYQTRPDRARPVAGIARGLGNFARLVRRSWHRTGFRHVRHGGRGLF